MKFSADIQEPLTASFSGDAPRPLAAGVTPCLAAAAETAAIQPGVKTPGNDTGVKTAICQKKVKTTEGRNFAVEFDKCRLFFYFGSVCLLVGVPLTLFAFSSFWSDLPPLPIWCIVICVAVTVLFAGWFVDEAFITRVVVHKDHLALHRMTRKVVMPFSRINRVALSENWECLPFVVTCPTADDCNVKVESRDDGIFEFSLKDRASFMEAMAPLVHINAGELLLSTLEHPV